MEVNQISTSRFDWNALVDKINNAAPSANVQGASFDAMTGNVTFTVAGDEGTKQITLEVPDLESPGAIDQTEFSSLVAKLGSGDSLGLTSGQIEEIKKTFAEIAANPLPTTTGSVMFDIYALMVLMLECAQKQRDASRAMRQSENEAIRTAIQNQADSQRSAALTGMIAGIAVGVLQLAMQAVSLAKSAAGTKQQLSAMHKSGLPSAQAKVEIAKSELAPRQAELTQMKEIKAMQDNVASLEAKTNPPATPEQIQAAKNDLAGAKAELSKMAKADVQAQEKAVGAAEKKLTAANDDFAKVQKETGFESSEKALESGDTAAAEKLSIAEGKVERAQAEFSSATDRLSAAQDSAAYAERVNAEGGQVTDTDITTKELVVTDKETNLQNAIAGADAAQKALNSDTDYIEGNYEQNKWSNIGNIAGAMGSILQSVVRSAADMQIAEATEMGADQKWMEEERDQTKDLFVQAQDVVKAVLSLFNAVIQAESASMRDAIHA